MYDSQMISDNDSIDFAFFDTERDHIKLYEGEKHSSCSKIITQAVIESNNTDTKNISHNSVIKKCENTKFNSVEANFSRNPFLDRIDSISNNTDDADVDRSLFNCLAYNVTKDDPTKTKNGRISFEDKEYSSNSSSGSNSTVTTITSDFTSISPLSFISNSTISSLFDESTSSSKSKSDTQWKDNANADEEDSKNSSNECDENEEGSNGTNCVSSKTNKNEDISKQLDETDNEENFNLCESENETENIFDDHSFCEDDIKKSEEDSYSETWESGSESGDRQHLSHKTHTSFQKSYESNGSEIGSWDLENEIENISLKESQVNSPQEEHSSFSLSSSDKILAYRKQVKSKRKKGLNLTFSREELIKIERDNLILLKKIMSQSKPRTIPIHQSFSTKKTSTAINRAKHQKQIEQDNYVSLF